MTDLKCTVPVRYFNQRAEEMGLGVRVINSEDQFIDSKDAFVLVNQSGFGAQKVGFDSSYVRQVLGSFKSKFKFSNVPDSVCDKLIMLKPDRAELSRLGCAFDEENKVIHTPNVDIHYSDLSENDSVSASILEINENNKSLFIIYYKDGKLESHTISLSLNSDKSAEKSEIYL